MTRRAEVAVTILGLAVVAALLALRDEDVPLAPPSSGRFPSAGVDDRAPTGPDEPTVNGSAKDNAVEAGLAWLERRQSSDGTWHDPATTGIALLAFLGAGRTHRSVPSGGVVERGITALISGQDAVGCLATPTTLRDHAIAGLALTEAYGLTGAGELRGPARRAVEFAKGNRKTGGAWGSGLPAGAEFDLETTAWMSLLLKSAALGELDTDESPYTEIVAALDEATDSQTGVVRSDPRSLSAGTATAMAFATRVLLSRRLGAPRRLTAAEWLHAHPRAGGSATWLLARAPSDDPEDLPRVYFCSLGMLNLGGDPFREWLPTLTEITLRPPRRDGPEEGSWDPRRGGSQRDRVWSTAYHVLLREAFYGPVGHALMRK